MIGEKNCNSKLSATDVLEIRELGHKREPDGFPKYTLKEIAAQYGVTPAAISYILSGQRWTHIQNKNFATLDLIQKELKS